MLCTQPPAELKPRGYHWEQVLNLDHVTFTNLGLAVDFRFNAKRASLVQSRIKQLERLPVLKPIEKETDITLKFPDVEKLSPPILMLSEVKSAALFD